MHSSRAGTRRRAPDGARAPDTQQQIAARSPSLLIANNDAHTMPRMAIANALLAAVALRSVRNDRRQGHRGCSV